VGGLGFADTRRSYSSDTFASTEFAIHIALHNTLSAVKQVISSASRINKKGSGQDG
jgi:hypothetical protein